MTKAYIVQRVTTDGLDFWRIPVAVYLDVTEATCHAIEAEKFVENTDFKNYRASSPFDLYEIYSGVSYEVAEVPFWDVEQLLKVIDSLK